VGYAVPLNEEDRNEQGIPRKESLVQMSTRSK
jgi:hypothetical protein